MLFHTQIINNYFSVNKWIWAYLFIHIPSFVFTMYITLIVYVALLPISARSGVINSDLYVGVVTALATLYITSFIVKKSNCNIEIGFLFVHIIFFSDSTDESSQKTMGSLYILSIIFNNIYHYIIVYSGWSPL